MQAKGNRKWWILGALSFGLLAIALDMTILNVALPTLATDLNASTSSLQWIVDSYNLVLAAILLPAGMLGDRFGRKRFLLTALVLFGAASAGCAFSGSASTLVVARAFLGLGAAFVLPLSMSILPVLFHGAERTKAMMIWAMANMLGIPLGPIVGGWLLKHYDWGSVFLLNLPLVAVAIVAIGWLLPESRSEAKRRLDVPGILTSSVGLVSLTYGVIRTGEHSWSDPLALATMAAGAVLLAVFVLWERRTSEPLIDLSLFRSASFTWGTLLATAVSFALFGLIFAVPQYFQAVLGADAFGSGLRLLPLIGGLIVGARAAQSLLPRFGAKKVAAAGFAVLAAGFLVGTGTGADTGYGFMASWLIVSGLGLGFALPTSMDAALGELSAERSGVGSALIMAMRQVGGSFGVALLGAAMNGAYRSKLQLDGVPAEVADAVRQSVAAGSATAHRLGSETLIANVNHAFSGGMDILLWICGGISALGVVLALLYLPRGSSSSRGGEAGQFGA